MEKNLQHYVKSYKLVDQDICKQTIEDIEKINWTQHNFYSAKEDKLYAKSDQELDVAYSKASTKDVIMKKVWEAYFKYLDDLQFFWFNGWQGYTEIRFNRYKEKRLMAEHCDHIHSIFDGNRKGIPTMTALGLLNDDYVGGELVMFQDTVIPFRAGEILIFPSCFLFPHRIEPIKKGIRYSFVSWAW